MKRGGEQLYNKEEIVINGINVSNDKSLKGAGLLKKVVTVQAKTVEAAVLQALESLDVTREEVEVTVLENPSRRLLGLRKGLAKVKVTRIRKEEAVIDLEDMVEEVIGENESEPAEKSRSTVRIRKGELKFAFEEGDYPTIIPKDGVVLAVNDVREYEEVAIKPGDDVTLTVSDELMPPQFTIELIESQMIALLTFEPGKKIERVIQDTDYVANLEVVIEEKTEYYNDLKPQQIVEELRKIGVKQGIIFPAIQKVTEVQKPYELIVAKGVSPEEGKDGDLEVHIEMDMFDPDSLERLDFREMNRISSVKEGAVIATYIPPVLGTDGCNLLGQTVPCKKVQDVVLRLGKNISLVDGDVVSEIAGNPVIDWQNKVIKISVSPEFYHPGEVGLESGNIRSEGDIRIGGNVLPSMVVSAAGSVFVQGAVTQAKIEAVRTAMIYGNVLSSTIIVGKKNLTLEKLVEQLEEIALVLRQIQQAIGQILAIRESKEELTLTELKRFVHLFLEKKHLSFKRLNIEFVEAVEENAAELSDEWSSVAKELRRKFIQPLAQKSQNEWTFDALVERVEALLDEYQLDVAPVGQLAVPYAVNSHLYSNGDIQVRDRGVFQSTLIARNNIVISGVCRGGEVIAENNITLQETGSQNPVTTIVRTGEKGAIKIQKAYAGTEIQIGNRKYVCTRDEDYLHARLDEEGELILR